MQITALKLMVTDHQTQTHLHQADSAETNNPNSKWSGIWFCSKTLFQTQPWRVQHWTNWFHTFGLKRSTTHVQQNKMHHKHSNIHIQAYLLPFGDKDAKPTVCLIFNLIQLLLLYYSILCAKINNAKPHMTLRKYSQPMIQNLRCLLTWLSITKQHQLTLEQLVPLKNGNRHKTTP